MDYCKGVDLSTLPEVERCGGKFYDNGAEKSALDILTSRGCNWVRIRLWNDPYDASGEDYGAGVCDLPTVLALAARVKRAGGKWLLDLHYSDFWADPGKQTVPKAWQGMDAPALAEAVYAYTREVLGECIARGVAPDMVQVGNELSKGLLWPLGRVPEWDNIHRFVSAGVRAVRELLPAAPVMVHLDNGGNKALYQRWFGEYFARGGDCDVIGLSYYPFWHGTMAELKANMDDLAVRFGKDLIVVETSTAFTTASYAAYEKLPEAERKGHPIRPELERRAEYPLTKAGQCDFLRALLETIEQVPGGRGRGFFWWEPAWLPVPGSGWAKKGGWEYVHEAGPGGNEWANQCLFDYDGNALPALEVLGAYTPAAQRPL